MKSRVGFNDFEKKANISKDSYIFSFEKKRIFVNYFKIIIEIFSNLFLFFRNVIVLIIFLLIPLLLVFFIPGLVITQLLKISFGVNLGVQFSIAFSIVLIYPVLIFTGFLKIWIKFGKLISERLCKRSLWENFFSIVLFNDLLNSLLNNISKRFIMSFKGFFNPLLINKKWYGKIPFNKILKPILSNRKWYMRLLLLIFYMLRFLWEWLKLIFVYTFILLKLVLYSLFIFFTRVFLSIYSCSIVFFKGIGFILTTLIAPIVNFFTKAFNILLNKIYSFYPRFLELSLRNSTKTIITVLILFLISIFVVLPRMGSELIPEVHQGSIYINVTFPVGTPVEKSDKILGQISQKISALSLVESLSYYAGTTKDELSEDEVGEHIGKITVNIKKSRNLKKTEELLIDNVRNILRNFTDIDTNISRPVLFSMKPPVEVVIKGYNLEQLRTISQELYERISQIPGLKDVQSSVKPGFPELVVEFDRMKLSHYGMNAYDVATLIKNKVEGFIATKYKEKDKRIDVRVYLRDEQRRRAENIKNLIINPGGTIPILLSSVADVSILSGPNEIRRVDQDRAALITANIESTNLKDAVEKIYRVMEKYPLPPEFRYELSGQNKEMETSLNSLTMAMILAMFLVYIVMASQFESFLHPFLILFTIPMALIGVFFTLFVLNIPLGITVYIGMIVLVGIVVNNAIVLVDYVNVLRKRGVEKLEAIRQAGQVRLRPILMTTFTTVLGLLPMAVGMGEGTEIRTPMAVTIIAGLLSATFLTLVLIPIVYNKFSR